LAQKELKWSSGSKKGINTNGNKYFTCATCLFFTENTFRMLKTNSCHSNNFSLTPIPERGFFNPLGQKSAKMEFLLKQILENKVISLARLAYSSRKTLSSCLKQTFGTQIIYS